MTHHTGFLFRLVSLGIFLLANPVVFGQLDLNRDGFADLWQIEFRAYHLEYRDDDDGDETVNGFESLAGTDPGDRTSFLEPLELVRGGQPGEWRLTWNSVAGIGYQVQVAGSPAGPWENVGTAVSGNGEPVDFVFDGSGIAALQGGAGFARIRILPIDGDGDGVTAYEEALLGLSDADSHSNTAPDAIDDLEFARRKILETGRFGRGGLSLTGEQIAASRFLTQATFGPTWKLIDEVSETGIANWIDAQMVLPPSLHRPRVEQFLAAGGRGAENARAWAWWHHAMTAEDALRQRVAFALSEIFVVSDLSDIIFINPEGAAAYYDILVRNAFGSYEQLLREVTLSPIMGTFLSHLGNRKTDEVNNIFPDENYAREVMQLFSIGLYRLNPDGSRQKDGGEDIPTYDNSDITEMAKVFTGLNYGAQADWIYEWIGDDPGLFFELNEVYDAPMEMYDFWHEPGPKTIFGNVIIDEATPMGNVDAAIATLANHENVGPFLGRLLIQRLVKSNPSPAYVSRISAVWADDGNGVRGNLGAVVRAILLDPEARDRSAELADDRSGKLREPLLRFVHLLRAFGATPSGAGWRFSGTEEGEEMQQFPLRSPSVFNFYLPDFQPRGPISDQDLVGPEFQIMNSQTSIDVQNLFYRAVMWRSLFNDRNRRIVLRFREENRLAYDPVTLMDRLRLLLCQGEISEGTYEIIMREITHLIQEDEEPATIFLFAVTALATSPDYNVLR